MVFLITSIPHNVLPSSFLPPSSAVGCWLSPISQCCSTYSCPSLKKYVMWWFVIFRVLRSEICALWCWGSKRVTWRWVSLAEHLAHTSPPGSALLAFKARVQSCWKYLFIIQEMLTSKKGLSCSIPLWKEQLLEFRRQASCALIENTLWSQEEPASFLSSRALLWHSGQRRELNETINAY